MLWRFSFALVAAINPPLVSKDDLSDLASFALCCQGQLAADAAPSKLCGLEQWPCELLLDAQRGFLQQLTLTSAADEGIRPGIEEMKLFFQHPMESYLTGEITDPVFLDIEYVLPAVLGALAKESGHSDGGLETAG
ncbi:unnamed protein product, partial [Durusdinium trenchii]